jgi:ubiquinone/menaquinone biosynthesis C-methylase UbiE
MAALQEKKYVCPRWIGYFLISPLRRLVQDPDEILAPFVRTGMTVLEIGPGMGYFTLSLARFVGESGKVICVDVQEKMLKALERRTRKAGVRDRITTVHAAEDSLRIEVYENMVDFAFVFAVVHEVADQSRLFQQIWHSMKSGALLLLSEPTGHVTREEFRKSIETACSEGFEEGNTVHIKASHSVLLKKRKSSE